MLSKFAAAVRRFVVVEHSMLPALSPGDGLIAIRWPRCRRGQVRVFPDPTNPGRWLVKRVGTITGGLGGGRFEALSDNQHAAGVIDSRRFGAVPIAGSMLVIFVAKGAAARSA